MVSIVEVIDFLHTFAPPILAEDYDNVGLLIGNGNEQVHKILVTLDVDEAVAKEAKEEGADMIVCHHPLIFKPLSRIVETDAVSRTVISLIKNDIALFAMHTNFDSVKSGLGDLFLDKIGVSTQRSSIEGDAENGIGRTAIFKEKISLSTLLEQIKTGFSLPQIRYVGDKEKKVEKIAVCNGGGGELVYQAHTLGADCFVTGDIKYHHARYAYENNMALIEVPHYAAEKSFMDYGAQLLREHFGNSLKIVTAKNNMDIWNLYE